MAHTEPASPPTGKLAGRPSRPSAGGCRAGANFVVRVVGVTAELPTMTGSFSVGAQTLGVVAT